MMRASRIHTPRCSISPRLAWQSTVTTWNPTSFRREWLPLRPRPIGSRDLAARGPDGPPLQPRLRSSLHHEPKGVA